MRDLYESGEHKISAYYWCFGFSADSKFLATGQEGGDVKVGFLNKVISSYFELLQIWIISQIKGVLEAYSSMDVLYALSMSPRMASGLPLVLTIGW